MESVSFYGISNNCSSNSTLVVKALAALLTSPVRDSKATPPTLKRHVAYSAVRAMTADFSPLQHQYIAKGTDAQYESFCKSYNVNPDNEILTDGTRALWIGPRTAKKVIIHFHGGGYVIPAADYTFKYLHSLREGLRNTLPKSEWESTNNELLPSILVLSYDLSPGVQFPRQLIQATHLLNHAFNKATLGLSPSSIILSGDSAGANLALALLSHIAHPRSDVPLVHFPENENFLGLVLVSPWADFNYSHHSFKINERKDDISTAFLVNCSQSFLGTKYPHPVDADTNYTQPARADAGWWKDIPVDRVLVTGGEDEILVDGIRTLGQNLKAALEGHGGEKRLVEVLISREEAHEAPFLDTALGTESGESARRIESWVKSKL